MSTGILPERTAAPARIPRSRSTPPDVHPDSTVDLLWATELGDDRLLAALDWSGMVRGRLTLPMPRDQLGRITPSPDGQRLLVGWYDGAEHVLTAQGRDLGAVGGGDLDYAWAGDDTHVCAVSRDAAGTSAQLSLITVGGHSRAVTTMHWPDGDGGMRVAACDVPSDLAVVSVSLGDDNAGHVVEYEVVRLSTGATVRDVHPPGPDFSGQEPRARAGALWDVIASPDAGLLILTPYSADAMVHPQPLEVVDSATGRELGRLTAEEVSFAGDDAHVFTEAGLVDWRTGHRVNAPGRCCGAVIATRPGAAAVVLAVPTGPPPTPTATATDADQPPDDYVVLSADGATARLACCGSVVLPAG